MLKFVVVLLSPHKRIPEYHFDRPRSLRRGSNNDSTIAGCIGQKLLTIYTFIFLHFYILYLYTLIRF
jgi:hypothetical protein